VEPVVVLTAAAVVLVVFDALLTRPAAVVL
jgi:hypothetical protein